MPEPVRRVAIVDYGLGNIFSVKQACAHVGLESIVTGEPEIIRDAAGVILPGVGAFGDAMQALRLLGADKAVTDAARQGVPVLGICLGMQLLMERSSEFGSHEGLGILQGSVDRLSESVIQERRYKVPHVGWNEIRPAGDWSGTPLADAPTGSRFYFVHSYVARPEHSTTVLAKSVHGQEEFVSAVREGNVFGFQFHPERSGPAGLRLYARFASLVATAGLSVTPA